MIKEILLDKFNKDVSGKDKKIGKKILEDDLISDFNISSDEGLVYINSKVLSEDFYSEYINKLELDVKSKSIISTYCTCEDFEKNEFRKENYCCKHLFATFYKFLNELDNYDNIKKKIDTSIVNVNNIFKSNDQSILNLLLEEDNKAEIKLEVYINRRGLKNRLTA